MTREHVPVRRLLWVCCFAVAFAFVEASVVVYLRALYYPDGFSFPLRLMSADHLAVELAREAATVVMLAAVGAVAGGKAWQRFGYFMTAFGVWDVFFYVWLKVILGWPATLFDPDILFLIPVPWIGPVIAPVLVSVLMTGCGMLIVVRISMGEHFQPVLRTWLLALGGTMAVLYSFMDDAGAIVRGSVPGPYHYELLAASLVLFAVAFATACRPAPTRLPQ